MTVNGFDLNPVCSVSWACCLSNARPMMVAGDDHIYIMAIRAVKFSSRGTRLERFLPKNQHAQRKLLNFENWVKMSNCAKI